MREPGERLYLYDDTRLGVRGSKDTKSIQRHYARYEHAIQMAGTKGGLWLDFACGSGYGTEEISRVADFAVGLDRDPVAIGYASMWHGGSGRMFHQADETSCWDLLANWKLSPVDVVVSVETLEHMERERQVEWVGAVSDHLVPGGVFVLECPLGSGGPSEVNPWHLHEPTLPELEAVLRERFHSVEIRTERYVSTADVPATQALAVCRQGVGSRRVPVAG